MHTVEMGVLEFLQAGMRVGGLGGVGLARGRALAAANAHYATAARRSPEWKREAPVRLVFEGKGCRLTVRGRVDALLVTPHEVVVEEIKATWRPLAGVQAGDNPLDVAQLRLYHHFACTTYPDRRVGAALTYVEAGTGAERSFRMDWEPEESRAFAESLAVVVLEQAAEARDWRRVRDRSLAALKFPFPELREGQGALLAAVEGAIKRRSDLLVEAATGIGKTMAVLYPALRNLGREGYSRIFYLTAKTAGAQAAAQAVALLREQGMRLRVLYLQAKERMCPLAGPDRPDCLEGFCPYAERFNARVGKAVLPLLAQEEITPEAVLAAGMRDTLCPFELALEVALGADLIVCDYNYAFDPAVHLRRFFAPGEPADNLFLVDEAHNLVPRGREMYSATLTEQSLGQAREALGLDAGPLAERLFAVAARFPELRARIEEEGGAACLLESLPENLADQVAAAVEAGGEMLPEMPPSPERRQVADTHYALAHFSRIAACLDNNYAIYAEPHRLRLFCLNPGPRLAARLEHATAAIFLSGTLSPARYFETMLGAREGAGHLVLPSPFPRENRLYLHVPEISTRYVRREETKPTVAQVIVDVARARPGSYLAFFPSYAYLGSVAAEIAIARPEGVTVIVQRPGMRRREQGDFLRQVSVAGPGSRLGLAVMGGLFGEAVDLPGEQLVGVIIVGPALPPRSMELELIRAHFDEPDGEGFLYAYVIPGMIRVIQAAGRVFRTPEDRGVVVLLDDRFLQEPYRELLPADWGAEDAGFSTPHYRERLEEFWG